MALQVKSQRGFYIAKNLPSGETKESRCRWPFARNNDFSKFFTKEAKRIVLKNIACIKGSRQKMQCRQKRKRLQYKSKIERTLSLSPMQRRMLHLPG
ncbi:MAG: hypothetical protein ACK5L3_07070 [Oscillospiraceae bacterium]